MHLADTLSNAAAGAIALAWSRRESSVFTEIEDYVASLDSPEKIQRWFNACKLGMAPRLLVHEVGRSCRLLSDPLWAHLVQLHPEWSEDITQDKHALWNLLACDLALYATDLRSFERFEALLARVKSSTWSWDTAAARARKMIPMQYLWDKGWRPLDAWVINWFHLRSSDHPKSSAVLAQLREWDDWVATTVLPAMRQFPDYNLLYRYVTKEQRLSLNASRAPRLEKLRQYLPLIHYAAAWHNDPCWLSVRRLDDEAWCNYAALHRLLHPQSFYKFAPDLERVNLNASLQDIWNMAYALHWTWPMLVDQLTRLDQTEDSLDLPGNFADT